MRASRLAVCGVHGGVLFTANGQHVVAPTRYMGELAVTAYRLRDQEIYLRPMARIYWGRDVSKGFGVQLRRFGFGFVSRLDRISLPGAA